MFSVSGELHSLSIAPTTSQAIDVAVSVASPVPFHLDKIKNQIRIDYDYLTCLMNCRSQYTAFLYASSSGLRASQELAQSGEAINKPFRGSNSIIKTCGQTRKFLNRTVQKLFHGTAYKRFIHICHIFLIIRMQNYNGL